MTPLAHAFGQSVARSLPVPAASAGVTFTFDPVTSAFVRTIDIAGQLFLENARPIGRGVWNVGVTYERVAFDTLDGHPLDDLHDTGSPIVAGFKSLRFTIPRFDLSLVANAVTTSVTYGVTRDLDVNLTLPVLESEFDGNSLLRNVSLLKSEPGTKSDAELGPGDLLLRAKYRFFHARMVDVAAGLVLRFPTGNPHDYQGTGVFEMSPLVFASTPSVELAPGVRAAAHLNAGLDLVPSDFSRGEGRYGVGVDVMIVDRATLSVAFLGREPFSGLGSFAVPRADGSHAPLFGISPGHPSYYDVSVGLRVDLWRDTVFGVANVLVPVNQQGVRASVIPLFGLEATY